MCDYRIPTGETKEESDLRPVLVDDGKIVGSRSREQAEGAGLGDRGLPTANHDRAIGGAGGRSRQQPAVDRGGRAPARPALGEWRCRRLPLWRVGRFARSLVLCAVRAGTRKSEARTRRAPQAALPGAAAARPIHKISRSSTIGFSVGLFDRLLLGRQLLRGGDRAAPLPVAGLSIERGEVDRGDRDGAGRTFRLAGLEAIGRDQRISTNETDKWNNDTHQQTHGPA